MLTKPTTKARMEGRHRGDKFIKTVRGMQPDPLTTTLTMLKTESDWVLAMLREKRARDQEILQREEGLRVQEPVNTGSGGQQRSADHPHRVNTGYQTMSADQLEDRGAHWGRISLRQIAVS